MTNPADIARALSEKQREALISVCRTNGGGVSVRCRVGDDGYGIPVSAPYRRLFERGLIQGKAGAYECVVHTRDGLNVYRHLLHRPTIDASTDRNQATVDGCGRKVDL